MNKTTFLIICLQACFIFGRAQCNQPNTTFKTGEKATYTVYYNWGFVWLHAAEVSFETRSKTINKKKAYYFVSEGRTLPNYDWFFKVRDKYKAIADSATLTPYWYSRNTSEGKYEVHNQYWFNYNQKEVYTETQNSEEAFKRDTLKLTTCTLDLLTAIYKTRNLNYDKLSINETVPIKVIVDGELYSLHIRYLGKENITNRDDRTFNCVKFSVLLIEGTIFTGGENMMVWVSDDKNRIPVYVEAKILVGSIKAQIQSIEGNRYPLSSDFKAK